MKKLLVILFIFSLYSCEDVVEKNLIVEKVEFSSSTAYKGKYKVYINTFPDNTILYTDKLYTVGDTLK